MAEVKLNKAVFDSNINNLKTSVTDLGKVQFKDMQLTDTNVNRLKKMCTAIETLSQNIKQYEKLLEKDVKRIQGVGDAIVKKDEQLEKAIQG